eukprot:5580708-Amphidinium_carterae.1
MSIIVPEAIQRGLHAGLNPQWLLRARQEVVRLKAEKQKAAAAVKGSKVRSRAKQTHSLQALFCGLTWKQLCSVCGGISFLQLHVGGARCGFAAGAEEERCASSAENAGRGSVPNVRSLQLIVDQKQCPTSLRSKGLISSFVKKV